LQLHRLAGGSATGLSATGAWAILVSLDVAAADDSSSLRLILKTSETFVRHWQIRPLTDSKRPTPPISFTDEHLRSAILQAQSAGGA
jgi:hypothetical protein